VAYGEWRADDPQIVAAEAIERIVCLRTACRRSVREELL
jgi:hypothetical protein